MAVTETRTKLPLYTWAKLLGIHPLHFEQVRFGTQQLCDSMIFQHSWQASDHVSREEIAQAIAEAEAKIEEFLGYRLLPTWEKDEWRATTRPIDDRLVNLTGEDARGYKNTVRGLWGYFISGGVEAKTLISAGVAVVYSDEDSDGYAETATVSVATTVTNINEIAVYYPSENADDQWEIRPIKVSISGGTATITFRKEQAVKSSFFETVNLDDLASADGSADTDFLATVDVYRHWNDPETQVNFLWEPLAYPCGDCDSSGCPSCAYSAQDGCLTVRGDARNSILGFSPATWVPADNDFTVGTWAVDRQPDITRLYYYAGQRDKRSSYSLTRMPAEWERTVAYMAAAMLDRPLCDCSNDSLKKWREDFALQSGSEDGEPLFRTPGGAQRNQDILDNPFGTRRGEIYAWNKVRRLGIMDSVNFRSG